MLQRTNDKTTSTPGWQHQRIPDVSTCSSCGQPAGGGKLSQGCGDSDTVRAHAQLSQAIGEENKLSKVAAEGLEETLDRAKAALSRGLKRVNRAMRRGRSNHMIYLVAFAFAMLLGVYVWAKLYRVVRWLI